MILNPPNFPPIFSPLIPPFKPLPSIPGVSYTGQRPIPSIPCASHTNLQAPSLLGEGWGEVVARGGPGWGLYTHRRPSLRFLAPSFRRIKRLTVCAKEERIRHSENLHRRFARTYITVDNSIPAARTLVSI